MEAAARAVVAVRSRASKGDATGAAAELQAVAKLGVAQLSAAVTTAMLLARVTSAAKTQLRAYEEMMLTSPLAMYPITLQTAKAFVSRYVLVRQRSSNSLKTVMGTLRPVAQDLGLWSVTEVEGRELARTVRFLQQVCPAAVEHARSFFLQEVRAMQEWARANLEPAAAAQHIAVLNTSLGFLCRGKELEGLKLGGVGLDEEVGATLLAKLVKVDKETLEVHPRSAPHLPEALGSLCVTAAMTHYVDAVLRPAGAASIEHYAFPRLDASGVPTATALTAAQMVAMVATMAAGAKIPLHGINAHWGRATGYNIYRWVVLLGVEEVTEMGDWAMQRTMVREHYSQGNATQLAVFSTHCVRRTWETQCCSAQHPPHPSRYFLPGMVSSYQPRQPPGQCVELPTPSE